MPFELSRQQILIEAQVERLDPKSEAGSRCSSIVNAMINKTTAVLSDTTERSVIKRRLSQTSESSSTEFSENDSECDTKSTYSTKSTDSTDIDQDDIRNDLRPKTEHKLFADLPDPSNEKLSPDEFLYQMVFATCGVELEPKKARTLENFFAKFTDEQIAAYTITVVSACRSNDLDALKKLHTEEGQTMNCFNRFGESLLTMACRRGFEDIVDYLLGPGGVDIRIVDDSGRTVLHDACWNPSPQLKICQWIMRRDPSLFFIADNRGCTPFQYARPQHRAVWRQFLFDNKDCLGALASKDIVAKLSKA